MFLFKTALVYFLKTSALQTDCKLKTAKKECRN